MKNDFELALGIFLWALYFLSGAGWVTKWPHYHSSGKSFLVLVFPLHVAGYLIGEAIGWARLWTWCWRSVVVITLLWIWLEIIRG